MQPEQVLVSGLDGVVVESGCMPHEHGQSRCFLDAAGELVYIAPSRVNLQLTEERWPDISFAATREHASAVAV